jgi:hypothetical protein
LWDLDTGLQRELWPLPWGRLDTLAFHGPNQLLLCRLETKDRRDGPFGHVDPKDNPRVVRRRDLLRQNPTQPLWESLDFHWEVMRIVATPDGAYFGVDGHGGSTGRTHKVRVFEGPSGKIPWPTPSLPDSDYTKQVSVNIDPSGTLMSFRMADDGPSNLLEIATGRLRGVVDPHQALGPRADQWILESSVRGRWGRSVKGGDEECLPHQSGRYSEYPPSGGQRCPFHRVRSWTVTRAGT